MTDLAIRNFEKNGRKVREWFTARDVPPGNVTILK